MAQAAKWLLAITLAVAGNLLVARSAAAHEVPDQTTVLAFLKPEGSTLRLLVRAPLKAMRDVTIPNRAGGFLDLPEIEPALRHATQIWLGDLIAIYENGTRLERPRIARVRAALPADRSFGDYATALAHFDAPPLGNDTDINWEQGMLEAELLYPIRSERSDFALDPALNQLALTVNVILRFLPPGGSERAFNLHPDAGPVQLDPSWVQAFTLFVREGFLHILSGYDHLLFLFCLVLPLRRLKPLLTVVTAFTLAHSVTLIASALGLAPDALWFAPLIETLIALSILYMALANIAGAKVDTRWIVTFFFGLVHGFGFADILRDRMQFAGSHLISSLLAFNVGVELGQIVALLVLVPGLALLFRLGLAERIGVVILSALAAHSAWHWTAERADKLMQFRFASIDATTGANLLGWATALVALGGIVWLVQTFLAGRPGKGSDPDATAKAPLRAAE
ncbi:MAG: HupE/UreJ family protein [Bauldia sp.]